MVQSTDVRTHPVPTTVGLGADEGLRAALHRLTTIDSWQSALGKAVVDEVRRRASSVARRVHRNADLARSDLVDHLVSVGWEVMATRRDDVLRAVSPWGLVYKALLVAGAEEMRDSEVMLSRSALRVQGSGRWHTARRRGVGTTETKVLHFMPGVDDPVGDAALAVDDPHDTRDWDAALAALRDHLVAAGAPHDAATQVIAAALDVVSITTRRSYIHHTAYRDERLTRVLGRPQIAALMDLLIGSRRSGPAGSAWLALRDANRTGQPLDLGEVHPASLLKVHRLAEAWAPPGTPDDAPAGGGHHAVRCAA